jgi:protein O-mannosyl-transferase
VTVTAETAIDTSTAAAPPRRWPYILIVAAVLIVWGHTVGFSFVWDDKFFIEDLQSIRSISKTPSMFYSLAAQSSYPEGFVLFRPLRTFHYAVLVAIGGGTPKPALFHLINVLWHCAATILLYKVLLLAFTRYRDRVRRDLDQSSIDWAALVGALAFAIHPVASEVVCWAKSLDDIMATAFLLGSSLLLLRWQQREMRTYWQAAACFALAVYSKESAVPFAAFAVFLLYSQGVKEWRKLARLSLPFFAIAAVFVVHRHLVIGRTSQAAPLSGTYLQTLIDTFTAGPIYARLLAGIPPFCIDYSFMKGGHAFTSPPVLAGFGLLVALVVGACLAFRKRTVIIGAGFAWVLLFLLPVSNLIPMMQYCAERFLYTPMIGWSAALAGVFLLCANRKAAYVLAPGVLAAWALLAWSRSWIWSDPLTLFVRTHLEGHASQRVSDNAVAAAFNLPHIRAVFVRTQDAGQPPQLSLRPAAELQQADWPGVERSLEQLRGMFTNELVVATALGIAKVHQGKMADAIPLFEEVAQHQPNEARGWNNLARACADAGQWAKAENALQRSLSIASNSIPTLEQLAQAQWNQQNYTAAKDTYLRLQTLDPRNTNYAAQLERAKTAGQ